MWLQLGFFWYWSNILIPNLDESPDLEDQDTVMQVLLTTTAMYLLVMEISSVYRSSWAYFRDKTRLFNLITPILLLTSIYNKDSQEVYFWNIQMFTALCVWFRFLLYLRTIKRFSWLIRMITETVSDMKIFLVVFFIGAIAFADAFVSIAEKIRIKSGDAKDESEDYYDSYFEAYVDAFKTSFTAALGDFTLMGIENYDNLDWFVFILLCIFNIIVLLNLLIAIISETFTKISDTQTEHRYKEKTSQMTYVMDTFYGSHMRVSDPTEFVFIAQVISQDLDTEVNVDEQIGELRTEMAAF